LLSSLITDFASCKGLFDDDETVFVIITGVGLGFDFGFGFQN
jgi:hypothetical protein